MAYSCTAKWYFSKACLVAYLMLKACPNLTLLSFFTKTNKTDTWKYQYYCSIKTMATKNQGAFQGKWATLPNVSFLCSQFCPPLADLSTLLSLLILHFVLSFWFIYIDLVSFLENSEVDATLKIPSTDENHTQKECLLQEWVLVEWLEKHIQLLRRMQKNVVLVCF